MYVFGRVLEIAVTVPSQRARPPRHRACTLSLSSYAVLSSASLWPCSICLCCVFFLKDSECLACWGRVAVGQFLHVARRSSPLVWKCAVGVRFLQVGHVRYSISAVGMYHQPYSWCGRGFCGNRCWGMRTGKVLCSMVFRSALSGSVSMWTARATWALSCHPRTCIRNSRWPPSAVDLGGGFSRSWLGYWGLMGIAADPSSEFPSLSSSVVASSSLSGLGFLRKKAPSSSGVKRVRRSWLRTLFFPLMCDGAVNLAFSVFS